MIRIWLAGFALALLVAAPIAAAALGNPYLLSLATRAGILAIATVSLQLVVGFGGLVSLGHAAFLGIGAYAIPACAMAGLTDAAASAPAALVAGGGFALATGWFALRTRGVTFLMITLGLRTNGVFRRPVTGHVRRQRRHIDRSA
ncbi:MAG TPA: hypothetical protein VLI93_16645, partial [Acetobacteraceae bacterium]|nr:hypothetical protein [Acetobacteraceae bacterium]